MSSGPSLWKLPKPLVLASKSPTRRLLLENAGLPIEIDAAGIDEREIEAAYFARGGDANGLARELARAKALDVSARHSDALCLGADQVLSLEGRVLHKPASLADAARHLAALAGRSHRLTSAFALARAGELVAEGEDSAEMTMRALDEDEIALYLRCAGADALASVGAYQAEFLGVHLFERIAGDHATILGLPLLPVLAALRREGALAL